MNCPDGLLFLPQINGSVWKASSGIWMLISCPAGYSLTSGQCVLCPAACYCTGGSIPPTPCGAGMFSVPGARSAAWCYSAIFVVLQLRLPIFREHFTSQMETTFKQAVAAKSSVASNVVAIVGIVGDIETFITCNVATPDASKAADLYLKLSLYVEANWSSVNGFFGTELISLKVTGCVAGFTLDSFQVCQLCPSNFYCPGGSMNAQPCPVRTYSLSGSNSSSLCLSAVFVIVVVNLPISGNNFSIIMQFNLKTSVAKTVGVQTGRVVITSTREIIRRTDTSIDVTLDIAGSDNDDATLIAKMLDIAVLNHNLESQGLPNALIKSILNTATSYSTSSLNSLPLIVGTIAGGTILVTVFGLFWFWHSVEPEDERQLRKASQILRSRLGIRMGDGYLLNTEAALTLSPLFWRISRNSSDGQKILQRSYLEAAARLSMLQVC